METQQERQATGADRDPEKIQVPALVLASTSPRRTTILRGAGFAFDPCAVAIDETRGPGEDAVTYVERLALAKAEAGAALHPSRPVLGADTVVVIEGEILGKPSDEDDARRMLRLLSGAWHEVLTGVALVRSGGLEQRNQIVAHQLTKVKFAPMTAAEIEWYLATGEAMDKAGAYAIQGQAARFIEEISGDYLNIVGLPVRLLYKLLRDF
jgi:nucleoside triphosphate pyrophosphatase